MFFHTRQIFLVSHNNQLAFTEASFSCGLWSEQDKTADCLEDSLTLDDAILIGQSAISFWLLTQDFLLEELLKEAWTYTGKPMGGD